VSDRESWEARYAGNERVWSDEPNPSLRTEISALPPGSALDLGCGEGADAVWLAVRGWHVTAVDFARPALARGRAAADAHGVAERITWIEADLLSWQPPPATYDLVNVQYLHLRDDDREVALLRRAAEAVAPDGRLLIAGHEQFPAHAENAPAGVVLRTAAEILEALDLPEREWAVEVAERRTRPGHHPHSEAEHGPAAEHDGAADGGPHTHSQPDHVVLARRLRQR